jgi:hypothetical protein
MFGNNVELHDVEITLERLERDERNQATRRLHDSEAVVFTQADHPIVVK